MRQVSKLKLLGLAVVLSALLGGSWIAIQAAGGQNGVSVKALNYDDRVRFVIEGEKISILRAEIFDLAGRRLFDSGPIAGKALDWTMTTETGERVAYGVYLYVITAWDSQGQLLKNQLGKLALVPGGVGLGQAPPLVAGSEGATIPEGRRTPVVPLWNQAGDFTIQGSLGVGTESLDSPISIMKPYSEVGMRSTTPNVYGRIGTDSDGFYFTADTPGRAFKVMTNPGTGIVPRLWVNSDGLVGINTTSPSAALEVKGSTANLLVLKDPVNNIVFRVEKDGDVYADRAYYCGLASGCFNAGTGADVAERIDTSELVEPGDVVEIDPKNPGLYRKAQLPYSTRVAGVISTAPAITLGNAFDTQAEKWEDPRPLLALAGRVPVKVTTENGPIKVGDLLVSSSLPGYAMRCSERTACVGAIIGKALEPLKQGSGMIAVQVMLR